MKKYLNKESDRANEDLLNIENIIASLSFRDISVPAYRFENMTKKAVVSNYSQKSGYVNFFQNISITQKRIFSIMMSAPAMILLFAFTFWTLDDSDEIYLASNDVQMLEESNLKIIEKINSLENLEDINNK